MQIKNACLLVSFCNLQTNKMVNIYATHFFTQPNTTYLYFFSFHICHVRRVENGDDEKAKKRQWLLFGALSIYLVYILARRDFQSRSNPIHLQPMVLHPSVRSEIWRYYLGLLNYFPQSPLAVTRIGFSCALIIQIMVVIQVISPLQVQSQRIIGPKRGIL